MTLGNVELNPAAGPLFLDWESGDALQLTGPRAVDRDAGAVVAVPGALRMVELAVDHAVHLPGSSPLPRRLIERSPFNPPPR